MGWYAQMLYQAFTCSFKRDLWGYGMVCPDVLLGLRLYFLNGLCGAMGWYAQWPIAQMLYQAVACSFETDFVGLWDGVPRCFTRPLPVVLKWTLWGYRMVSPDALLVLCLYSFETDFVGLWDGKPRCFTRSLPVVLKRTLWGYVIVCPDASPGLCL